LRDILSECGSDALVLIDEICAGTDPAEGGALAAGVLDSLLERGAGFVVTTHQSSLKQYALTRSQITNASLAFDEKLLQPTFAFQFGVPGNSYAFDLARNVGLPDVVMSRAKGYLGERHDELEESINTMQKFRREAEELKLQAAQDMLQASRLKAELEERTAQIREKRKTIVDEAREEASETLRKANALIENTIREIREGERSAAEAKAAFEAEKNSILSRSEERGASSESYSEERGASSGLSSEERGASSELKKGTSVRVNDTVGEVVEIEGGSVVVLINGIKFKLAADNVQPITKKERKAGQPPKTSSLTTTALDLSASTSLDMRGMRADEGHAALEHFIDTAIMTNIPFAAIIHGKGTGALRTVVHEYLKDRSGIKSWRNGTIHEGGDGVTIIEFL